MKKFQTEREMQRTALLKEGDYKSIRDMLDRLCKRQPQDPILAELDGQDRLVTYTVHDLYEEVMNLGDGLLSAGLGGAHIAIIAENCCRYIFSDIAISNGVGVVTPIDAYAPDEQMALLLNACDADAVLCGLEFLDKVRSLQPSCPRLKTLIVLDGEAEGCLGYDEVVARGKALSGNSVYRNLELDMDAPAKILFTSGTTGSNKGVVLTNANLTANMINCMDTVQAMPGNTSLSVLPMHHATEINANIMSRIGSGRLTYINGNIRNLMANMKRFRPDVMTVVPMIVSAFYKSIWAGAKKNGKEEKLRKGIKLSNLLRTFGIDKTHQLFADVFAPFGGRLCMIVCGGSMLNPEVIRGMNDLGVRIENAYGITECGPLISMNAETLKEHLSVGRPCPGLEVRLDAPDENGIGEICVRGKSVAKGYYKDPEATAQVFDADGFFHTGDMARQTSEGRLFLMGRKKNTIILPNGKNVNPEEVENVLETRLPYVDEVVVYQADYRSRDVMVAGLYIKDEERRADRTAILADVRRVNDSLEAYKRIEYVELPEGEYPKTRTRKIRRQELPASCSGKGLEIM